MLHAVQHLAEYNPTHLRELARHPNVFVKLSEIPVLVSGKLMTDPHYYQARLDTLWDIFGEDHILFGSDTPYVPIAVTAGGFERMTLSDDVRTAIDRNNAVRLFPRFA